MADEITIDTIRHFNDYYGFEHLNPMITIGRYAGEMEPGEVTYNFGVYAIYIKETKGCKINSGLTKCRLWRLLQGRKLQQLCFPDRNNFDGLCLLFILIF